MCGAAVAKAKHRPYVAVWHNPVHVGELGPESYFEVFELRPALTPRRLQAQGEGGPILSGMPALDRLGVRKHTLSG